MTYRIEYCLAENQRTYILDVIELDGIDDAIRRGLDGSLTERCPDHESAFVILRDSIGIARCIAPTPRMLAAKLIWYQEKNARPKKKRKRTKKPDQIAATRRLVVGESQNVEG